MLLSGLRAFSDALCPSFREDNAYGKNGNTPKDRGSACLSGQQGHEGSLYFAACGRGTEGEIFQCH